MPDIAGRLFLLFLLGVDWAADPSLLAPAVRPLAAPMASTECFCHSWSYRQYIRYQSAPHPTFPVGDTIWPAVSPPPGELWAEVIPAVYSPTRLVYVFMSILC